MYSIIIGFWYFLYLIALVTAITMYDYKPLLSTFIVVLFYFISMFDNY